MISQNAQNEAAVLIDEIEKKSLAEFVCVSTKRCVDFRLWTMFLALFGGMVVSLVMLIFLNLSTPMFFALQLSSGGFVWLVFDKFSSLCLFFVPRKFVEEEALKAAKERFGELGFYQIKLAVMFFVSFDEKFAAIITTDDINRACGGEIWQGVIDDFINLAKNNNFDEGLINAIKSTSKLVIKEFPSDKTRENLIQNSVIKL